MSDKVRKIVVFCVLIAVSIWGYSSITERMNKRNRTDREQQSDLLSSAAPGAYNTDAASDSPTPVSDSVFVEFKNIKTDKDPFYHNYTTVQVRVNRNIELHLLGILYRKANAQALINGKVVKVGDVILGYSIEEIATDFVKLKKDGKTLTLRPKKEST
ncbi:MAG: hypothetical protein KAR42_09720 [candidate division Zixibacteria bacterium]|nr:hypothetical protein [candidate division Zixibacteria bacterium]